MILISFKVADLRPEGMKLSKFNEVMRNAWQRVGEYWHQNYLGLHFGPGAKQRYGYIDRSGEGSRMTYSTKAKNGSVELSEQRKYTQRKHDRFGHSDPLEFTGRSRRATRQLDVRATRNGARVVLHAPAFNFKNLHSPINMADEVRAILPEEFRQLEIIMMRKIEQQLARASNNSKR